LLSYGGGGKIFYKKKKLYFFFIYFFFFFFFFFFHVHSFVNTVIIHEFLTNTYNHGEFPSRVIRRSFFLPSVTTPAVPRKCLTRRRRRSWSPPPLSLWSYHSFPVSQRLTVSSSRLLLDLVAVYGRCVVRYYDIPYTTSTYNFYLS